MDQITQILSSLEYRVEALILMEQDVIRRCIDLQIQNLIRLTFYVKWTSSLPNPWKVNPPQRTIIFTQNLVRR